MGSSGDSWLKLPLSPSMVSKLSSSLSASMSTSGANSVVGAARFPGVALVYYKVSHASEGLLGSTLFLRSQRVALKARFLPLSLPAVFSMALGLMCWRLLTALERASCSSSSSASSCVVLSLRDLRLNLRQIFFSFPWPTLLTSCLRSQPRGILASGSVLGSKNAASVSSQVVLKVVVVVVVGAARLRGEGTMTSTVGIMLGYVS